MKIYVASSFSLINRVELVVEALEEAGHEITVKWWNRIYDTDEMGKKETQELKKIYSSLHTEEFYSKRETRYSYLSDLEGIEEADFFILVGPMDASRSALVGGNIELGYALALRKPCFGWGAFVNSAMYWGLCICITLKELMEVLELWGRDQ